MHDLPEGQTQHDQTPACAASRAESANSTAGLERLSWYEHGKGWALAESFENPCGKWTSGDIARAFEAGALAAEKLEREACAKVCDEIGNPYKSKIEGRDDKYAFVADNGLGCAAAIRARSNVELRGEE